MTNNVTRNSDKADVIATSPRLVGSRHVTRTRTSVREMVDTLNINCNVDQQGRSPDVEQWRLAILKTYYFTIKIEQLKSQNRKAHFISISPI